MGIDGILGPLPRPAEDRVMVRIPKVPRHGAALHSEVTKMKIPRRVFAFIILLCVITYLFWGHPPNPWTWTHTLGLCLMLTGFPLWLLAHVQLGTSFTAKAEARSLVTHGLYGKIRNPIYLFGSIAIIGILLFLGRPYLLVIFVVLVPVQLFRMAKETKVLEEKFGDEYRNYRRATWF
jgi:protein-S-isoprenylcysteine O-methyltransferase Ste14